MTSSPCWLAAAIVASLSCYAPAEQSVAISGSARTIDGDTPEIGPITTRLPIHHEGRIANRPGDRVAYSPRLRHSGRSGSPAAFLARASATA